MNAFRMNSLLKSALQVSHGTILPDISQIPGPLKVSDIRQIPGNFEARIALLQVEDLEGRQHHAAVVAAADEANTEALITALQYGAEAPRAVAVDVPETPAVELKTARLARERLEAEAKAARNLLERRPHCVSRCARGAG
jgi:hypothetical protein